MICSLEECAHSAQGDEYWDDQFAVLQFTGLGIGTIKMVGDSLYVGGTFRAIGGVSATNIAKWNGTNWSAFGTGLGTGDGDTVSALAIWGDDLYAGGYFTNAGSQVMRNVARWDGTNWMTLASGVNAAGVYGIAEAPNGLVMAGAFDTAGGISATNVAKWDGQNWSALDGGVQGTAYAIAASGQDVYVGGRFNLAGGVAATNIAKWNGTNWSALGFGVRIRSGGGGENGSVRAIAANGRDVYVAGGFSLAGSVAANNVAKWNGAAWESLQGGVSIGSSLSAAAVCGNDLYVGGPFLSIGGVSARGVAKWDGNTWSPLGSGTADNPPLALVSTGSELILGGRFTVVGGKPSNKLALWHIPHSLSIQRSGNNVTLSWPATGTNFLLEATSDLRAPNWQWVSSTPSIVNDQCVVTLPLGPDNQFFRLRRK